MREKVITVTVELKNRNNYDYENRIKELKELVESSGGEVAASVTAPRDRIDSRTYVGSGKLEEIKDLMEKLDAHTIIFNHELSGSQMKNLENTLDAKIVDRTNLILDIFATRAKTKEAVLQVELAQLKYRLPRLIGYRDYLSREGAGIGTRGPGEQKLELDRRVIQRQMSQIKKQLEQVENTRQITRNKRIKNPIPQISIIGYTNAGKSTIAKAFLGEEGEVFDAKDQLFHTLDTTLRKVKLNEFREIVLSDTVGFIEDLPTFLIEAFKSTLEEIRYADLILEVVDSNNDNVDIQRETTRELLRDMDIQIPVLTVFNKVDLLERREEFLYADIEDKIFISALDPKDILRLKEKIEEILAKDEKKRSLLIPYEDQEILYNLLKNFKTEGMEYVEEGASITVFMNDASFLKYKKYERVNDSDNL